MAKVVIVEPFYGGSHRQWADGWKKYSNHEIKILGLPAHNWKWRMHGGAISLAEMYIKLSIKPDWIIATDMLDLTTFLALIRKTDPLPKIALYFHENQLTYPWSPTDQDTNLKRDHHYQFINFVSALSADICLYNSDYNRESFLSALPSFLKMFPDYQNLSSIESIKNKSQTLHLGLDLTVIDKVKPVFSQNEVPTLLWNHRWEYDKNPELFFNSLFQLKKEGISFNLIVVGQSLPKSPSIFKKAKKKLSDNIMHWGFCESKSDYHAILKMADILPVTSNQDFFGGSVIEAIYAGAHPILPNRLAYPEHFIDEDDIYYEDENAYYAMLKRAILYPSNRKSLTSKVIKYDWTSMSPQYDSIFSV